MPDPQLILVVDDDDAFRERLVRALRERGFLADGVASVPEVEAAAIRLQPAFAIVDLRLPGGTGLEVVRILRRVVPGARVVVLTGYGSIATALEAIALGAANYLTKPASVDEILAAHHNVSMFSPRELTLVFEVEDLGRSEKRVAALAEGVARPAGESCIVLIESAGDTTRKTLEPLRAACAVRWEAQPLQGRALVTWGERRLASEGVKAEAGTLEALAQSCEGDSLAFFNELGKLLACAGAQGTVGRADLAKLSRPTVGADLPDFLAAVASGQPAVAAQRLGRLIAEGENEGGLLFLLGNLVGGALGGWAKHPGFSATLRSRRPPLELARALDAVYRAEAAWKSGRLDALTALEQATREVAAG